jgi:hypothetical protein
MDLRDFDVERLQFSEEVYNYLDENIELREGLIGLLNFIQFKQEREDYDTQIPVVLATKTGSWIRAELVGLDEEEVMTSEGKGSFMVHKINQLVGLYPPLAAV